jgi:multidrug transporter EmrE-like cation transporter
MNTSDIKKIDKNRAILITVLCVVLLTIGQTLMKIGFSRCSIPDKIEFSSSFLNSFVSSFLSTPWILMGYSIAIISSILYLEALHKAEFGITTAVMRLNYITAYCIGIFYFGESFNIVNLIGMLLIFSGVLIISLSKEGEPC